MGKRGLNNMDELFINLKETDGIPYIRKYFNKQDLVSIEEIINTLEFELKRQEPKETEWDEYDKETAYECEQIEERQLQEHFRGE